MKETLGEMPESNGGRLQSRRLVKKEFVVPFVLVTSLFFVWGFARAILDVLNKHFQMLMDVTMTRSAMIQATTYIGYFLMAIPAGVFITRRGYRPGVVLGLLLFGIGSLMFIPGEWLGSFDFFLVSLFVIGCGLVVLETAANPYVTELGDSSTAPSRLNLAQSFNGLGCILAPVIVGGILFSNPEVSVALPYTVMGVAVLGVAVVFCFVRLPEINSREQIVASAAADAPRGGAGAALRRLVANKGFMAGVGALFCYEIAEISINTFFINYATDGGMLTPAQAATVLSVCGLGLFMVARVAGSFIMSRIPARKVLAVCSVLTVAGSLAVALDFGMVSRCGVFVCYAFEAIMFPTVFALTIPKAGSDTKMASSLMMMTPLGGAVGTTLMGWAADSWGIATAFVVPCAGYVPVMLYAMAQLRKKMN